MVAQGDASRIASKTFGHKEKESLLAMKALIEKSLQFIEETGTPAFAKEEPSTKEEPKEDDDVEMLL
jgi:hypothetical protein